MRAFIDREGAETRALRELVDFTGKRVLEVGCGDGRVTWRYADRSASVLAIDPIERDIRRALRDMPRGLQRTVRFEVADITAYALPRRAFDVVVLSHSL